MPENPFRVAQSSPQRRARPADPCAMVIFGAHGDLTKRLVVPALYNLSRTKVLPENFALIGSTWRRELPTAGGTVFTKP